MSSTRAVITDNFTTINPSTDGFSPLDPINGFRFGLDGIWKYVGGVRYRASNGSIAVCQKVKGKMMIAAFQTGTWVGSQLRICCPLIKMAKAQFCKSL